MIKIFQAYYRQCDANRLDPAFLPFNNTANPNPKWREYWILQQLYPLVETDYVGLVSWKFKIKTKISGETFIEKIVNAPTADVYFINPFENDYNTSKYFNVWAQAEYWHPRICDFVQQMFNDLGIIYDLNLPMPKTKVGYCNFWVGNKKFWDLYMNFTLPIFHYIENLEGEWAKFVNSRASRHVNVSYHPYIMERMFSTLLCYNPDIASYKIYV
jgi:hypothetical protein